MARDFATDESVKNEGILDVFLVFNTARMWQKIRHSAADDLFRGSLGAKAVKIEDGEIIVRQGGFTLTVKTQNPSGHPLRAPVGGAMVRTIHEHPSCRVSYRFEKNGISLLNLDAPNAAFEYEY